MDTFAALEPSPISLMNQKRSKMLLNDINENRFRAIFILTRLDEAEDEQDIDNTLQALRREEVISPEQYEKLMSDD